MIETNISGFNPPYNQLNNIKSLKISPISLAWAMVSLGNTPWRDFFHGQRPNHYSCIELIAAILGNTSMESGYLKTSKQYRALSDADLGTATYRLGTALSKYVSCKTIGTKWLQNALPLIHDGIVLLQPGSRRRPDYIGRDTYGNWHSLEAKGRSSSPGNIVNSAKVQAKVVSIHGKPPTTKCVSISHLYTLPIRVDFADPDPEDEDEIEIIIDELQFIRRYYTAFIDLLDENIEFNISEIPTNFGSIEYMIPDYSTRIADFPTNVRYGISRRLFELLTEEQFTFDQVSQAVELFDNIELQSDTIFLAPDGTVISLE